MIEADTFGQVAGLGVNALVAADDRAAFEALTARVFQGDSGRLEFQLTGLKGAQRWLETHAAPLRDEHGAVTALLGITRDITDRKRAEEALAIKSEILTAVTESLASYVNRGDWREALGRLLRCALGETRSEYGFIGVVVGESSLRVLAHEGIVWDKILNREFYEQALRRYEEVGYLEFASFNNLFGRAITTGGVVIANLPARDARSGGLPPGHPPMRSFLGVPIFAGSQVTGVVALANRPGGYTEEDQRRIETLVQHAGGLCASYRLHLAALGEEEERRRAEQALRVSDERFRLLSKATNDAIWDWDLTTKLVWWNEGYEKLFGHRREEVDPGLGSWTDYLHPEDLPRVNERIHQVIEHGGTTLADEYRFRCADGSYRHVLDRGHIIRDAAGQPVRMIGGMTDLTERKRAEESVRQQARQLAAIVEAQRKLAITNASFEELMENIAEMKLEQQFLRAQRMESIGTLAGGIAHDLNNLLAPITMGVQLLRMNEPNASNQLVLDNIQRSAKRGADLVKQVLSFARGVEGARVSLQVRHILQEIESIVENTFPKSITLETSLPADLWSVMGDPTQLNQVFLNLCVNARDALKEGGRLVLRARNVEVDEQYAVMNRGVAAGAYVVVEVADNGCGIPREVVDRIFEPFFTTKELGKGTGLGLSTALGIMRSHGGFVNVYSEPGKGSTFKVYLPAQPGTVVPEGPATTNEKFLRGAGELILVVDDEASILAITKQTLEAFGYNVLTAEDGAHAIGLFAQHPGQVAVVLTDMMMPVMDGPMLVASLQRINPAVRIIGTSGLSSNVTMTRATLAGVKHFLPKPYSAEALLALLRQVLGEAPRLPPR